MTEMCSNCGRRLARYRSGECEACYVYRHRTGKARPEEVVMAHLQRRSRRGSGPAPPSLRSIHEMIATVPIAGGAVLTRPQRGKPVPAEEVCGACGTVKSWAEGRPYPLCVKHRAVLGLASLLLDEPEDLERLLELVTA